MTDYPAFLFGHQVIQVVDDYVYLGINFNCNGSIEKAISEQALKSKKKKFSARLDKIRKLC